MQYDENAEKYGYEGEMTPMKCDKLKAEQWLDYGGEPRECYPRVDVDAAIAELKEEVDNLLIQNKELCQALQVMYSAEEYAKLHAENAKLKAANKLLKEHIANGDVSRITWIDEVIELNAKLEKVQATAYADSVDAGMRERRLRRTLWRAIALFCARSCEYFNGIMSHCLIGQENLYERCEKKKNKYQHAMYKCRAKMEEYK